MIDKKLELKKDCEDLFQLISMDKKLQVELNKEHIKLAQELYFQNDFIASKYVLTGLITQLRLRDICG